jgi:hypothetical protein
MRLVRHRTSAEFSRACLGYALVDAVARRGVLATLFVDRIPFPRSTLQDSSGALLGHVLAHKVAHLVLGSVDHVDEGLFAGGGSDELGGVRSWMLDIHGWWGASTGTCSVAEGAARRGQRYRQALAP